MEIILPHPGVLSDQQYDELYMVFLYVYLSLFVSLFMVGKHEKQKMYSTMRTPRPLYLTFSNFREIRAIYDLNYPLKIAPQSHGNLIT